MTMQDSHFDAPPDSPYYSIAMQKLNKLQADLIVAARMLAIEEVGAAVAHQLNEPLTALLVYLNELEQAAESAKSSPTPPTRVSEIVAKAAREAERACEILERTRNRVETPVDMHSAVAWGCETLDGWAQVRGQNGGVDRQSQSPSAASAALTSREREVLAQITAGATNKEGAYRLGISVRTFEVHRAHIMRKVGAKNAADLVRTVLTEIR